MKTPASYAMTLLVALLLAACGRPEPVAEPVRAVKLLTVGVDGVHQAPEFAGEVRARVESRLGFRVGGKLLERPAEVGQAVRAGQLLAQLDPQDLALASQAAQAQVSAAQTQRDLAAADFRRYQELRDKGFISSAELERRQAQLDAAEAAWRQTRAQAAVQGNQAGYSRLVADAAGVVVGVDAEVGQVVAAGAPVVRLARDGARDVVFAVPEGLVARVRPGVQAQVRLGAASSAAEAATWQASVREVAASADPVTRTYAVKLALPTDAQLPLGATAYVRLAPQDGQAPAAIRLPTSALMRGEGSGASSTVWVFDPATSTVQLRPVVVAGADGNALLIADGLRPGEAVVATGVHVLAPGQKVARFHDADRQQ